MVASTAFLERINVVEIRMKLSTMTLLSYFFYFGQARD